MRPCFRCIRTATFHGLAGYSRATRRCCPTIPTCGIRINIRQFRSCLIQIEIGSVIAINFKLTHQFSLKVKLPIGIHDLCLTVDRIIFVIIKPNDTCELRKRIIIFPAARRLLIFLRIVTFGHTVYSHA